MPQARVFGFHIRQDSLLKEGIRRNLGRSNSEWARLLLAQKTANVMFVVPAGRDIGIRAEIHMIKRVRRNPGPGGHLGWFVALASTDPENPFDKPVDEKVEAFRELVGLKRQPQWAILA